MGFRFRKSIRIAPGFRMSFGKRGIGMSVGVKGLRYSLGSRGIGVTASIPGTGLSYSAYSGTGPGSRGRSAYRALQREAREQRKRALAAQREAEKAAALAQAKAEHEAHESVLESLRTVLRGRERDPFPWDEATKPQEPFARGEFVEPPFAPSVRVVQRRVAERHPVWGWLLFAGIAILGAGLGTAGAVAVAVSRSGLGGIVTALLLAATSLMAFASFGACVVRAFAIFGKRRAARHDVVGELQVEHETYVARLREAHEHAQQAAASAWEAEEVARKALRSAVSRHDPEPLAQLLEAELSDEDFPIPVVCEVDFEDCQRVTVTVELPELDDIPEERTVLTSTGKLSHRKFAQRDRVALFEDLCCGIALRLAHETFRVLPMVSEVTVEGCYSSTDALGHDVDAIALRFSANRRAFAQADLDRLDPSDAVRSFGSFKCSKRGELLAL